MTPTNPPKRFEKTTQTFAMSVSDKGAFFNNVLNFIPDIIFVKDDQHRWVYVNDAFCNALGHAREAYIGKTDYDFHPREEADVFWEMDNRVLETGTPNVNEEVYTNAAGEQRTILTKKNLFRDEKGKKFLVGISQDITDCKRAESALADSQRRLSDIIEFLPDSTFVIDRDGSVIAWNRAVEAMTGVDKREILGKGGYAHAVPFYGASRPMLIDLVLNRDEEYEAKYLSITEDQGQLIASVSFNPSMGDKGRYLESSAARLYGANGNVVGAIESIRDITALKDVEQERERLIADLREAVAKVRTLSGLLPICASCRKVRDDKGYWSQIESYIREHTDVGFSHGLCPECMDKIYGEQDWYKRRRHKIIE